MFQKEGNEKDQYETAYKDGIDQHASNILCV